MEFVATVVCPGAARHGSTRSEPSTDAMRPLARPSRRVHPCRSTLRKASRNHATNADIGRVMPCCAVEKSALPQNLRSELECENLCTPSTFCSRRDMNKVVELPQPSLLVLRRCHCASCPIPGSRRPDVGRIEAGHPRQSLLRAGSHSRARDYQRLVHGTRLYSPRPHDERLDRGLCARPKITTKLVGYLSAEFLIGPQLANNLLNVHDIQDSVATAVSELGLEP